jgi:hypothetical protein
METKTFLELLVRLTGTPVKPLSDSETAFLSKALANDKKIIDYSEFNELLLLTNKDRVEAPFFAFFFGGKKNRDLCAIGEIENGIERFQKMAMLRFGNFIYAYRQLSRIKKSEVLLEQLGHYCAEPKELLKKFRSRRPKVLEIEPISREHTYLVGFLSAGEITTEEQRASWLLGRLGKKSKTWKGLKREIQTGVSDLAEVKALNGLINRFQHRRTNATTDDFRKSLEADYSELSKLAETLISTQKKGERNTDTYLTWDHLDIYFATSMRKRWEYEDLYDFVNGLMRRNELRDLNLRYFDPTQSFDKNRIDKGLVEALMLKRAACTVYSVQDTDTLGKDSELAATLAQGKPVIAYAPAIDVNKREKQLMKQRPAALYDRLRFVLSADEKFVDTFETQLEFIEEFSYKLDNFEKAMLWRSFAEPQEIANFVNTNQKELKKFCRILAVSEQAIYDRRALTLREKHPLAIQVNLKTGVANGVLVVRDIPTCAKLIRRILTNAMEFEVKDDVKTNYWHLRETETSSIYRVVTKDPKLTNCFWNFYREKEELDERPV